MTNHHPNLDDLLRQHPATTPIRPHLAASTVRLAVQANRIRRLKRLSAAAAVMALALLAAKWLGNDLAYLVQLPLTQLDAVKDHSQLYLGTLWESLPKIPLIMTALLGTIWLAWRSVETLLTARRITGVTQGTAMKIIKFTPRLAILSAILGATALGTAGYAVAQQAQQHKLEILRQSVNDTGRTEIQTNQGSGACSVNGSSNATGQYEVKKNATVTPAEATQIIRAACLEAEAADTLRRAYNIPAGTTGIGTGMYDHASIFMATQVIAKSGDRLTLALPAYNAAGNSPSQDWVIAPDIKVFKDGAPAALDAVKPGDIVLPYSRFTYTGSSGSATGRIVLALVILPSEPGLKWYSPGYRAQITEINTCAGNPEDRCSFTGSVDFYPSGGGEGNVANPAFIQAGLPSKEIAGVITEIAPAYTKIKTSSGRVFQLNFGSDPAAAFNATRKQHYGNDPVTVGDKLLVRYTEAADQHATTIPQDRIFNAVLVVEFAGKDKPINQY